MSPFASNTHFAGHRRIDDKRNALYRFFVKLVEEKHPLAFVAENVKGILTLGDGAIVALHPSSPDMQKTGEDKWVFGDGKTRRLSWQEAAAIQTFPSGMEFAGSLTSKYKQIGNAVPVKLAEVVAEDLYSRLNAALAGQERYIG